VSEGRGWVRVERDDQYFRLVAYAVGGRSVGKPARWIGLGSSW